MQDIHLVNMSYFKTVLLVSFLSLISAARRMRLGYMHSCTSDKQCRSQSCITLCGTSEKSCTEPRWFFERHGMGLPDCVERDAEGQIKYRGLSSKDNRELGETCAVSSNCKSGNCVPRCGHKDDEQWTCIQQPEFWLSHGVNDPVCMYKDLYDLGLILMDADKNNPKEVGDAVDSIKQSLARHSSEGGNDMENRNEADLVKRQDVDRDVTETDNEVNYRHEAQMERKAHSEDKSPHEEIPNEENSDEEPSYDSEDLTRMTAEEDDKREAELKIENKVENLNEEPVFEPNVPAYLRQGVKEEAKEELKGEEEDSNWMF